MLMADLTGNGGAFLPEEQDFKAAVTGANARGGIKGHPIKLIICDTQSNVSAAQACGQQAVSDHVFAVIGESTEDTMIPYLQQANIPFINLALTGGLSWTSPVSFVIDSIGNTSNTGIPFLFKQAGCSSFDYVQASASQETPVMVAAANRLLKLGSSKAGITFKGEIFAPPSAPDMAPYETQAVSRGVDCIEVVVGAAQEISLLQALIPVTSIKKIAFAISTFQQPGQIKAVDPIMAQLGSRVFAITATDDVPSANPLVAEWAHDQSTYAPGNPLESVSAIGWASLHLAIQAADAVYPNVTANKVLAYLNTVQNFWPGVVPPVSFNHPAPPNPLGPRVYSVWIAATKWTGGKVFPRIGPFVNGIDGTTNNNTGS
jgi:hypothetical protein